MDKRLIGFGAAAIVISAVVLFAQATLVGVMAALSGPITPHDITLEQLEWRGLWHSTVFTWALPSALGAVVIASFKPQNWGFYSVCAISPGIVELLLTGPGAARSAPHPYYLVATTAVDCALIPMFLALYYALIRRHTVRT